MNLARRDPLVETLVEGGRHFSRAAIRRDESGAKVGTTWGDTACLFPLERMKFVTFGADGRESIIRCRWCRGCRALDRKRLKERLWNQFHQFRKEELWELHVEIPRGREESLDHFHDRQARLISNLRRMKRLSGVSGFYRLGASTIALIVAGRKPNLAASITLRPLSWTLRRVRLSRGRRAFEPLTAGMMRARDEYGEETNRFYHRGLAPLRREMEFTRATRYTRGIAKRHRVGGSPLTARAWMDGITTHLSDTILKSIGVPKVIRRRGPMELRVAGGLSKLDSILDALDFTVIAGARSAPPTVSGFRDARSAPEERTLILNQGARYSSSRQISRAWADAWAVRMSEIARKRAREPDE